MNTIKKYLRLLSLIVISTPWLHGQSEQPYTEETRLEFSENGMDCGHLLDGPSYYIKKLENKSLDNMFSLSRAQKKQIGEANYEQILKKNKLLKEYPNKRNIQHTFSNLIRHANSSTKFKLHVLSSSDINAFTMIGGHIYLTTGLLSYIDSMDELAFILGHEIGHHEKLHLERKIKKIMATSTFFGKTGIDEFTKIAIDLNNKFSAPFDQINEYEADKYGFELAKKAGYDVSHFADFFKKLEKNERRSILVKLNSTHPFSSDRRRCLESYISN
ncbi:MULTISPECIES: M48 family metallopeptidase [Flavobacteriaceae]|uniref:M48 family metallopeptidase n=1 Tax=Flavobacteriaceae TaxID=49546 RepID=UPI00149166B6|nr:MULTISPECIES: M48 family metallopeptidase [Allomuricauda]MDC6366672.1 M48 family metallopeptidase [Muricauda sp. AC10]